MEKYREKLKELPENDPKTAVYNTYLRNLSGYLIQLYSKNPPKQLNTTEEEISKAIEELKKELDNDTETGVDTENLIQGESSTNNEGITDEEPRNDETIGREQSSIHEERSLSQSDFLVERDGVNNNMDEYVDYKEV